MHVQHWTWHKKVTHACCPHLRRHPLPPRASPSRPRSSWPSCSLKTASGDSWRHRWLRRWRRYLLRCLLRRHRRSVSSWRGLTARGSGAENAKFVKLRIKWADRSYSLPFCTIFLKFAFIAFILLFCYCLLVSTCFELAALFHRVLKSRSGWYSLTF